MHDTASDMNSILNSFLKIMSTSFAKIIIILTQTFWDIFYYLKQFQTACTVMLCKSEKSNYITFRVWKSIALLSMIEKIIKIITTIHLKWMTEAHNMLSKQQMKKCQDYSTETVLDLLINQMHEIWNAGNYVVFLLILDITKIYDRMICKHFIHVLRIKKISVKMIN